MGLKEYKTKRNFLNTKEPKGNRISSNSKKKIFVIQYHKARTNHFDLSLEFKGELLSWAVPKGLSYDSEEKRLAVMVENHPLQYSTFEGVIPKGNYGAGSVEIFDTGYYEPLIDINKGLKKGHLKFILHGKKLCGEWSLVKIDEKNWLAIKGKDEYEKVEEISKVYKNPFEKCSVTLATLTNEIPKSKDWGFEIKYDGYRILSFIEKDKVKLFTRNGNDYTTKFPKIETALKNLDTTAVLDGEVVALDKNGRSDFGLLQENLKNGGPIYYVVFDILALNGQDFRDIQFTERRKKLEIVLNGSSDVLILSSLVIGNGKKCFNIAKNNGLEGIVAKKLDSVYSGNRSSDWLKIKCYARQEFVIGGFTTTSKNPDLSALLLGYYDEQKFIFVGKVGTGFNEYLRKKLAKRFKHLEIRDCPFDEIPKIKNMHWLQPKLVAEIQFTEFTKDNILRQPSFIGLREDKNPKEVKLEV